MSGLMLLGLTDTTELGGSGGGLRLRAQHLVMVEGTTLLRMIDLLSIMNFITAFMACWCCGLPLAAVRARSIFDRTRLEPRKPVWQMVLGRFLLRRTSNYSKSEIPNGELTVSLSLGLCVGFMAVADVVGV